MGVKTNINGVTREVEQMLVFASGLRRNVESGHSGVSGVMRKFFQSLSSDIYFEVKMGSGVNIRSADIDGTSLSIEYDSTSTFVVKKLDVLKLSVDSDWYVAWSGQDIEPSSGILYPQGDSVDIKIIGFNPSLLIEDQPY